MAEWPPTPLTPIPDPPDPTWPERTEVGPLTLIGPTGENRQPIALDTRTETLRGVVNALVAMFNFVQDFFLDRDGADAPIAGSTQGSYYMRGYFDVGGFKITNLDQGVNIRDAVTFEQLEDVQFDAEDTVEQILDTRTVFQDGSAAMISPLGMSSNRVINIDTAAVGTDAVRKDTVDTAVSAFSTTLLRRVGTPGMANDLDFDNAEPTENNYKITNVGLPTADGDLVNKAYLDDQVAITGVEDLPIAAVIPYAGPSSIIPTNFLLCDGREVSRFTYQNLFNIIGVAYGSPTSGSVFKLPNLRGRCALPLDNMGNQTAGIISDANARTLGGKLGTESHALSVGELPSHTHTYDDIYYSQGAAGAEIGDDGASDANNQFGSTVENTGATGSGTPHNNVQPSMAMNWLI
ncbi:MAG TPA: tail fiber protein, partial [Planctomycetota bacterium]|nr:tail fiber protein [Planctomycetota bacterium]